MLALSSQLSLSPPFAPRNRWWSVVQRLHTLRSRGNRITRLCFRYLGEAARARKTSYFFLRYDETLASIALESRARASPMISPRVCVYPRSGSFIWADEKHSHFRWRQREFGISAVSLGVSDARFAFVYTTGRLMRDLRALMLV